MTGEQPNPIRAAFMLRAALINSKLQVMVERLGAIRALRAAQYKLAQDLWKIEKKLEEIEKIMESKKEEENGLMEIKNGDSNGPKSDSEKQGDS